MKTYKNFTEWAKDRRLSQRKIIASIRRLVAEVAPQLEESSKWGNGVWLKGDLPIIFLYSADDHLQFGFFAGALLKDPKKILRGSGKFVRHIRIESLSDLDRVALPAMIRKAVKAPAYK